MEGVFGFSTCGQKTQIRKLAPPPMASFDIRFKLRTNVSVGVPCKLHERVCVRVCFHPTSSGRQSTP